LFQWNVLVANGLIHEVLVELNPILIEHLLWKQPICDSARNEFLFFFNSREFTALQGALHRLRLSSLNIIAIHMLSLSFLIERLSNLGHLALILPNLSHSSSFNDLRVDALCIIKILDIDIGLRNTSVMMHARILRARILIINDLDLNWEPGLLVHANGRVPQVFYLLVQLLEDAGHLLLVAEEVG
jgi:hypothetical protein